MGPDPKHRRVRTEHPAGVVEGLSTNGAGAGSWPMVHKALHTKSEFGSVDCGKNTSLPLTCRIGHGHGRCWTARINVVQGREQK